MEIVKRFAGIIGIIVLILGVGTALLYIAATAVDSLH